MRVSYAATVILVFVLLAAGGQDAIAQDATWGIKGGLNLATLDSDEEPQPEFKFRIGFAAGGFFTWPLSSRLDVQPELLYSQMGAKLDAAGLNSASIELDSFVAPILVRYKFASADRGLFVFGGPAIAFNVRAEVVVESTNNTIKEDIGDDIEDVDYGVVFGAGWQSGRWSIDGRYHWGLSTIGSDEAEPATKTRHRVISVLAGVRF
jgi:outer membrane immunogenic protein